MTTRRHERAEGMQAPRLGNYELIRRLGEGGMAQVYLARDVRLDREVAVKVLDKELARSSGFRDRFDREAKVAAQLEHENIVQVYDYGESGGVLYLVMPYLSGGSLQQQLKRTPFANHEALTYGGQICDALQYAHERGVIHRDVKPANMLLHANGRVMLADFGLAKILHPSSRSGHRSGHPDAGTPEYMAPEQIRGRSEPRSDLYGLGVVLYLLLTGRLPFSGPTSEAVMDAHLYGHPAALRTLNRRVTPAIEAVVLRALAKHPEDRFATASDMGAALVQALIAGEAEPLPFASGPSNGSAFSQPSQLPDISAMSRASYSPASPNSYRSGAGTPSAASLLPSLDVPEAAGHLSGASANSLPAKSSAGSFQTPGPVPDAAQSFGARAPRTTPFGANGYAPEQLPTRPLAGSRLSPSAPSQTALAEPRTSLVMPSAAGALAPIGQAAPPSLPLNMQPGRSQAAPPRAPGARLESESEPRRRNRGLMVLIALLLLILLAAAGTLVYGVLFGLPL